MRLGIKRQKFVALFYSRLVTFHCLHFFVWFLNSPIVFLWLLIGRFSDTVCSWLALLSTSSAEVLKVANENALKLQVPDVVWNPIELRETFWSTRKSDLQRELVKRCYYLM